MPKDGIHCTANKRQNWIDGSCTTLRVTQSNRIEAKNPLWTQNVRLLDHAILGRIWSSLNFWPNHLTFDQAEKVRRSKWKRNMLFVMSVCLKSMTLYLHRYANRISKHLGECFRPTQLWAFGFAKKDPLGLLAGSWEGMRSACPGKRARWQEWLGRHFKMFSDSQPDTVQSICLSHWLKIYSSWCYNFGSKYILWYNDIYIRFAFSVSTIEFLATLVFLLRIGGHQVVIPHDLMKASGLKKMGEYHTRAYVGSIKGRPKATRTWTTPVIPPVRFCAKPIMQHRFTFPTKKGPPLAAPDSVGWDAHVQNPRGEGSSVSSLFIWFYLHLFAPILHYQWPGRVEGFPFLAQASVSWPMEHKRAAAEATSKEIPKSPSYCGVQQESLEHKKSHNVDTQFTK